MELMSAERALTALAVARSPARVTNLLKSMTASEVDSLLSEVSAPVRAGILEEAENLRNRGVRIVSFMDPSYPTGLIQGGRPVAPLLFIQGATELLQAAGVGMSGSRKASELGLKAARACGEEVSQIGLSVVSGYAAGVDTQAHLAALESGGSTVIVLAEGINSFRIKREISKVFDPQRVLVVSQFSPRQPWAAHAAMARNRIIYGLGRALVVVEAGSRGGTLAAGKGAMAIKKPVYVLNFGAETPDGNRILVEAGALPVSSRNQLGKALLRVEGSPSMPEQPALDV